MATLFKSQQSQAARPPVSASQAGQSVGVRGFYSLLVAAVVSDTIQLLKWPANTVLEDLLMDLDPMDSNGTPTAIPQIGVLNAAGTALLGPVLLTTTAALAKVGGVFRAATLDFIRGTAKPYDRYLGLFQSAAIATAISPTAVTLNRGVWAAGVQYNAGDYLVLPNGSTMKATTPGVSGVLQPEWATLTGATTVDGGVTWTSASIVVGLTARFRNQNFGA